MKRKSRPKPEVAGTLDQVVAIRKPLAHLFSHVVNLEKQLREGTSSTREKALTKVLEKIEFLALCDLQEAKNRGDIASHRMHSIYGECVTALKSAKVRA